MKRKLLPIISLGKRSVIRSRLSTLSHDTITTLAQCSHNVGCELEKVIHQEYNATISTQEKKYLKFAHSPLQSFFKKLFIGTNLGKALLRMSENKAILKGLQDEEVGRGEIKRPPVPYIPPVDPIMDTVESKPDTKNLKVILPDGTIVYHAVYDNGSNKAFVIHVKRS